MALICLDMGCTDSKTNGIYAGQKTFSNYMAISYVYGLGVPPPPPGGVCVGVQDNTGKSCS